MLLGIDKLYMSVLIRLNIRIHKIQKEGFQIMKEESSYYDIIRRSEIKEENRRLRRLFLRYKEAEIVYSIQHKNYWNWQARPEPFTGLMEPFL